MNFIIVDSDIIYAKNLKRLLLDKMPVDSIQITRELKHLFKKNISLTNIILFEANERNLYYLESIKKHNRNTQTKYVALSNKIENDNLIKAVKIGISSIILKIERIDIIVEELSKAMSGKGSFPEKVINNMKEVLTIEEQTEPSGLLHRIEKYIGIKRKRKNNTINITGR